MNIYLDSIGCRLNQSEIEKMALQFRLLGHQLVPSPEACDMAVVNTCAVTSAAASDSRARARQIHRVNPACRLVLTGCWSTLEPQAAMALPGVYETVSNAEKDHLVSQVLGIPADHLDQTLLQRGPIPGGRHRTRAFIKAQDGCNLNCSYCITTIARGKAHSIPMEQILRDVRNAHAGGSQEAVLTGVHLSAYGMDLPGSLRLGDLIRLLLSETDIPRIRLSSLEPWNLPHDFFSLWTDSRLCRQLHLPLQSGCNATLKRMRRPIDPHAYAALTRSAREAIPGLSLTTDIIVGFPGESEQEFSESLAFVEEMSFASAHIFTFSPRPQTAAAHFDRQIAAPIAKERSRRMRAIVTKSKHAFMQSFLGCELEVLWEAQRKRHASSNTYSGLSDNYLRIHTTHDSNLSNQIRPVRIHTLQGEILLADLLPES